MLRFYHVGDCLLIGSIPSECWSPNILTKIYIKKVAEHRTTNTFRVLALNLVTSFVNGPFKRNFSHVTPIVFHVTTVNPLIIGLAAILGHTFSVFDEFRGGKAVATSAGMLLAYNPSYFIIACCVYFWFHLHFQPWLVFRASFRQSYSLLFRFSTMIGCFQ